MMEQAMRRAGNAELAERLLNNALRAVTEKANEIDSQELLDVATELRGQQLMARLQQRVEVDADDIELLLSDIKRQLARKTVSGLTSADVQFPIHLGRAFEYADQGELAEDVYHTVIAAIGETDDERLARTAKMLEGSIRRMSLLGNRLELKFTAVDGRDFDLAELRGKVVLIDFWATWCGPCVAGLPELIELRKEHGDKGFEIVGISFDNDKAALENFVAERKMPWAQFFDGNGWENTYGLQYGISAIPAMWLIDREGKVVDLNARTKLGEKIERLLDE
jgi:thiol-disulfide isomerase/thioredoxin